MRTGRKTGQKRGAAVRLARLVLAGIACLGAAACQQPYDAADWEAYEAEVLRRGLMRTERRPEGLAVTNAQLVRNFREIMFYEESVLRNGAFVPGRVPRRLEKFTGPVRYEVGGDAVRPEDMRQIEDFAERMRRVTGLEITRSAHDPAITILILDRPGRQRLGSERGSSPKWSAMARDLLDDMPDVVCAAYSHSSGKAPYPTEYTIVIPGEVGGILRQSCIEEEFGQTFGPAADFFGARPSVFNDDEEFALFTAHDEKLFRILYDPRLKRGMTEHEAMPIVRRIADEYWPGEPEKAVGFEGSKDAPSS